MINFSIDEVLPCLVDTKTNEILDTIARKIENKEILTKYNRKTDWFVNWSKFSDDTDIYALTLKDSLDFQGLIAVQNDDNALAVHVMWGCTAPHNNIWKYGKQRYKGVGGHLLAIASDLSLKNGYDGTIYAEAMDKKLFEHLIETANASPLPAIENHPYRFVINEKAARRIREVYNYEWSDGIL